MEYGDAVAAFVGFVGTGERWWQFGAKGSIGGDGNVKIALLVRDLPHEHGGTAFQPDLRVDQHLAVGPQEMYQERVLPALACRRDDVQRMIARDGRLPRLVDGSDPPGRIQELERGVPEGLLEILQLLRQALEPGVHTPGPLRCMNHPHLEGHRRLGQEPDWQEQESGCDSHENETRPSPSNAHARLL